MKSKEYVLDVAGFPLYATFTDLADQAHGSVILTYRDTTLLATAVMSKKDKDSDFFPLTVDLEERFYAVGKILGSQFVKREGRPSDEAILSGRVVDRTIRPLFDQHIRREIQIAITTLALGEAEVDTLGVIASSLALGVSKIPFNGPVSGIHIGLSLDDKFIINPTLEEARSKKLKMDVTICGKDGNINMLEAIASEIKNEKAGEAFDLAVVEIEKIQKWQKEIIAEIGVKKEVLEFPKAPEGMKQLFKEKIEEKIDGAIFSGPGKESINNLMEEWIEIYKEKYPEEKTFFASEYFEEKVNDIIHKEAIEKGRRPDGRGVDEVRPLFAKAGGISKVLHGSGIFYRGGTHVFSALTLGAPGDAQTVETIKTSEEKRFMHHYNFPPYSVGEPGRMGGLNRRMVGHGYLAEKSLLAVIPNKEEFPYTIRIVSESTASNGSTSMGSVCASTLALLDAGVPIKAPVAGIASGLMMKDKENYALITDIQGPEDHHGDMDFKVAGTRNGITGIQMDIKVGGIPVKILKEALVKAEKARLEILDVIEKEIPKSREKISPSAPEILVHKIKEDQIGLIIGTGGKTIKEIMEKTGAEINIDDDGTVFFTGKNGSAREAKKIVEGMTKEYLPGEKFEGVVTKILEFGVFVKIGYNTEGLVHVSEMAPFRIEKVSDYVKEGDKVPVVIKEIDEKGRKNLSIKKVNPDFFTKK